MRYLSACLIPLLCLASPLSAQQRDPVPAPVQRNEGGGLEVFSGVEFQKIELDGGQEAEKISLPLAARLTTGRLRLTAQLPYLRVTAPGNVIVPSGPLGLPVLVDPAKPAQVTTREGVGDLRIGAVYELPFKGVNASLSSGAKVPTASAQEGLGTGKADYWVGAGVSTTIGAITPFAAITYTKAGDPAEVELRDTLSGQAGAALRLGGSVSAQVGYSHAENASELARDEQRVFGGLNTGLGRGVSLGLYGSAGVHGPSDLGAGVSLGIGLK